MESTRDKLNLKVSGVFRVRVGTHFLGIAAGSLRIVRAACTMAMGVATYPASE